MRKQNASMLIGKSMKTKTDASFSCVCPVIDHEFRHNIVKVAVDPRGYSRVDALVCLQPVFSLRVT